MMAILGSISYITRPERSGRYFQDIEFPNISDENKEDLQSIISQNNWYISKSGISGYMTITRKYIPDAIRPMPDKLYHITPTKNIQAIQRNGILAKSNDMRHKYPPRIYLTDSIYTSKLLATEHKRFTGESNYTILEIDMTGLTTPLYLDVTAAHGCYYIQDTFKIPSSRIMSYTSMN